MLTRNKISETIKNIDKITIFIAIFLAIAVTYYVNPLNDVDLTDWNRTFCPAILAGISIDLRISAFYKLFFLVIPGITLFFTVTLFFLFTYRENYKDYFLKLTIVMIPFVIASYISRYSSESVELAGSSMMKFIIAIFLLVMTISFMDLKGKYSFSDITMFILMFLNAIITLEIWFCGLGLIGISIISACLVLAYAGINIYVPQSEKLFESSKKIIFILMWLPAFMRIVLEILYFLVEKGYAIQRYFTCITCATFVFLSISFAVAFIFRKSKRNLSIMGYIGSIISLTSVSAFASSYQYTWSCTSFAGMYESGNVGVAVDSILYGKLPIVDYFSAHALCDVLNRIFYSLVHGGIDGIYVHPYSGLATVASYIILFYLVKSLFDEHLAILYVVFFPGNLISIRWVTVCSISFIMMIYIYKKSEIKTFILFWICALFGAFYVYDEGISKGLACIVAFLMIRLIDSEWKQIRGFILSGIGVAIVSLTLYVIYALATGIPVVSRIREWMSLSLGSSSSWATVSFGDQGSFAFLISYFVVPLTAIMLLFFVVVKYIKYRQHGMLVMLTMAYALAEILFIPRTIIYHNLEENLGYYGIVLNFIHWTVSLFVLYEMEYRTKSNNVKFLAWTGTMILVIIIEGATVTQNFPTEKSALITNSINAATDWSLEDGVTENIGQPRIVADDETNAIINQFKQVFDTLLSDEETFIDFADVTAMYAMTGRVRPCYVGQSPSLLTDLYSQECFLEEISEYACPLAIVGTTETAYLQQLEGIPHNIRYYTIAEYIYFNYRPLVAFGEVAIWCENDKYDQYRDKLSSAGIFNSANGYTLVDYGYDATVESQDENGNTQLEYRPYHSYDLKDLPYIWANYDDYDAIYNDEIVELETEQVNSYKFSGSSNVINPSGNYLAFEYTNTAEDEKTVSVEFSDSANEGIMFEYTFKVKPSTHQYIIRVSEDYFWDVFNIDSIEFSNDDQLTINNVRILEGD